MQKDLILGAYILIVLVKIVVGSIAYEDGPTRSFWDRLWAAFSCVLSHDLDAMIGNHVKKNMRHLQHCFRAMAENSVKETMCRCSHNVVWWETRRFNGANGRNTRIDEYGAGY